MKKLILLLALSINCFAQVKLSDKDLDNLLAVSTIYSNDVNGTGKDFKKSLKALKTPKLNHLIETLVLIDGDKEILSPKTLNRPGNEELQLWYVIKELLHNKQEDNKNPRPDKDVAKETLAKKIDERWLLDNYYFQLSGGMATLFNDKNLSSTNFDLNSYQLKSTTEKAIFFFNIIKPMIQRFQVLAHVKNPEQLIKFAVKLPEFNGKQYYEYTNFDYEDFEWKDYDGSTTYNSAHMLQFYGYLMAHFMALAETNKIEDAKKLYAGSILNKPEYFKFSGEEEALKEIHSKISK